MDKCKKRYVVAKIYAVEVDFQKRYVSVFWRKLEQFESFLSIFNLSCGNCRVLLTKLGTGVKDFSPDLCGLRIFRNFSLRI